ncbi:hypothetical protein ACQKNS_24420 [Peribacillus sp. NPDC094092]|uniref:hypothetical protein n=1 Tax=Peribacillus sp. NPDC094092 TaxID=3390611 RepID=UPI003CFC58C9
MRELVDFLLEDIDNLLARVERQVGDPAYDDCVLNELNSILTIMKLDIIELDTLDDPSSILELKESLNKMIKEMESVIADDLYSPFRTLIWGMQQIIDLIRTN